MSLSLAVLAACGGGGDDSASSAAPPPPPPPPPPVATLPPKATISQLTNVSAADYAHNRWGLIEASTLATFVGNWHVADTAAATAPPTGRPTHLASNARLVVLQLNKANRAAGEDYIPSDPSRNVYAFELDDFRFNEIRDTGLITNSVRYQASGPTTDAWLAKYGIDAARDLIVLASGAANDGGFFQDLGRATYWLGYWGVDAKNIAIVNGSLQKNYAATLTGTPTAPSSVSNGGFSVKSIRRDATGLTVSLEDILAVVDADLQATGVIEGFNTQVIIDARPTAQFNRTATGSFQDTHPGQFITTAWNSAGAPSNDATGRAKNYVLYEGHIKGATSFPWAALLQNVGGAGAGEQNFKYRSKTELEGIFTAAGYAPADATTKVIVSQCRTNFEVQVNGFAARLILGYPTVFFDGSLVEYTSLVSEHPDAALNLLPADAAYKYRTDTAARSARFLDAWPAAPSENAAGVTAYNEASGTGADDRKISSAVINRNATTTRKALDEDRDYKLQ